MTALLRTLHLSKSVRAVDVLDLRPEAIQPLASYVTDLLPPSLVTNGALARSLVSGGVVNRSVVNQEQHFNKTSFSSIASNMRLEQRKCPSTTARTSAERFPEDFGRRPQ